MRLAAAAKHFDKQVFADAYGVVVFTLDATLWTLDASIPSLDSGAPVGVNPPTLLGQLDLFDDGRRDSPTAGRRTLSVAPGTVIPTRKALTLGNYVWLVGNSNPDYFGADMIRNKYTLHQADGRATIQTFGQYLRVAGGVSAFAGAEWVKAAKEVDESSTLYDVMQGMFASIESLPDVGMMSLNGISYLLREPHLTSAGFQSATLDEIKGLAKESGSFNSRTYDPVEDVWTDASTAVTFIRLRWQTHFQYLAKRTLHFVEGDDVLVCLKSAAMPKANDKVTLADGVFQVLTVQTDLSDATCWSLHVRRIPG